MDGGEDPANLRRSPKGGRSVRQDLSSALQDALAQVEALKAELDKVRRLNESLQAQLRSKSGQPETDRYIIMTIFVILKLFRAILNIQIMMIK